jgi:chromosome segregation ATPase
VPNLNALLQVEQLQGKVSTLKAASLEGCQQNEELQQQLAAAGEELAACSASRAACEERASAAEQQLAEARVSLTEQLQKASALESQATALALREEHALAEATELRCRLQAAAEAAEQDKASARFRGLCDFVVVAEMSSGQLSCCAAGSCTAGVRSCHAGIGSRICTAGRAAGPAGRH